MAELFGLVVRFTLRPGAEADFDRLAAETLEHIRAVEPGTLVYLSHAVEDQPQQRIFYELYRDRAAFDTHEEQPHVKRFLTEREQCVSSFEVDFVVPVDAKGIPNGKL